MLIEANELDVHFVKDYIMGTINLLIGAIALVGNLFWDFMAQYMAIRHQSGFGNGQIIWFVFWSIFIIVNISWLKEVRTYQMHYGK